jgi:peptidoglycan/LPS O-acetylase OafA/YrhL
MDSQAEFLHDNAEGRLIFIDALRVAAIVFVIIHHAAQAYGPTGGFWPVHDRAQSGKRRVWYGIDVFARRIFRAAIL